MLKNLQWLSVAYRRKTFQTFNQVLEDVHTLKQLAFPSSCPNSLYRAVYSKCSYLKAPKCTPSVGGRSRWKAIFSAAVSFPFRAQGPNPRGAPDPMRVATLPKSNRCLLSVPSYFMGTSLKAFITLYFVSLLFIDMSDLNFQTIFLKVGSSSGLFLHSLQDLAVPWSQIYRGRVRTAWHFQFQRCGFESQPLPTSCTIFTKMFNQAKPQFSYLRERRLISPLRGC